MIIVQYVELYTTLLALRQALYVDGCYFAAYMLIYSLLIFS